MNFSKSFNFFKLLLVSNLIAYTFNVSLLSSLFKDELLLINYELGLITIRNLAEMSPEKLKSSVKTHERKKFFSRGIFKDCLSLENSLFSELLTKPEKQSDSASDILDNMENVLSTIYQRFSEAGITLPLTKLLNIHYRVKEYNLLKENYPSNSREEIMSNILIAQKSIFDEFSEVYSKVINIDGEDENLLIYIDGMLDGMVKKIPYALRKFQSLESLRYDHMDKLNRIMILSIEDTMSLDRKLYKSKEMNAYDMGGIFNIEHGSYRELLYHIFTKKYDKASICDNSSIIMNTIIIYYSKLLPRMTYEQFKIMYHRLLERIIDLSDEELTQHKMDRLNDIHFLETQINVNHAMRKFNKLHEQETQEDLKDTDIKNEVMEALQSRNISLSSNEMDKMVDRIRRSYYIY
ncbi:hypothetical protein PRELSG_0025300 [Plasmodium relictum]|uniref:Uncharacterized protein n=1 Tax=Plasmodium relictum TaxID=85471 RepID=A0A1J1GMY3_PLARL|nr:hypothetical protein PRELSG_0025300 [Plasmodium relictum]CRG84693.1 hypothetical protein PRELSG_0025300 [Plasmodium relictum]